MNPYQRFASEYAGLMREGKQYPLGRFPRCPRPQVPPDAPKVIIFSPHPDDEVITGALPLRLMRKARWNVINIAVTLGGNRERQAERLAELKGCCDCIGFGLQLAAPQGLENIRPDARTQDPARWNQSVRVIAGILTQQRPRVICFPHDADWNSTHLGTHLLLLDALKSLPADFDCYAVETEFWAAMSSPNLMLEVSAQELSDLITALSFHIGEVQRNPYHLSLPAWMVDNVRRGSELIGGQGSKAADFTFATLYRVRRWRNGNFDPVFAGSSVSSGQDPAGLFGA